MTNKRRRHPLRSVSVNQQRHGRGESSTRSLASSVIQLVDDSESGFLSSGLRKKQKTGTTPFTSSSKTPKISNISLFGVTHKLVTRLPGRLATSLALKRPPVQAKSEKAASEREVPSSVRSSPTTSASSTATGGALVAASRIRTSNPVVVDKGGDRGKKMTESILASLGGPATLGKETELKPQPKRTTTIEDNKSQSEKATPRAQIKEDAVFTKPKPKSFDPRVYATLRATTTTRDQATNTTTPGKISSRDLKSRASVSSKKKPQDKSATQMINTAAIENALARKRAMMMPKTTAQAAGKPNPQTVVPLTARKLSQREKVLSPNDLDSSSASSDDCDINNASEPPESAKAPSAEKAMKKEPAQPSPQVASEDQMVVLETPDQLRPQDKEPPRISRNFVDEYRKTVPDNQAVFKALLGSLAPAENKDDQPSLHSFISPKRNLTGLVIQVSSAISKENNDFRDDDMSEVTFPIALKKKKKKPVSSSATAITATTFASTAKERNTKVPGALVDETPGKEKISGKAVRSDQSINKSPEKSDRLHHGQGQKCLSTKSQTKQDHSTSSLRTSVIRTITSTEKDPILDIKQQAQGSTNHAEHNEPTAIPFSQSPVSLGDKRKGGSPSSAVQGHFRNHTHQPEQVTKPPQGPNHEIDPSKDEKESAVLSGRKISKMNATDSSVGIDDKGTSMELLRKNLATSLEESPEPPEGKLSKKIDTPPTEKKADHGVLQKRIPSATFPIVDRRTIGREQGQTNQVFPKAPPNEGEGADKLESSPKATSDARFNIPNPPSKARLSIEIQNSSSTCKKENVLALEKTDQLQSKDTVQDDRICSQEAPNGENEKITQSSAYPFKQGEFSFVPGEAKSEPNSWETNDKSRTVSGEAKSGPNSCEAKCKPGEETKGIPLSPVKQISATAKKTTPPSPWSTDAKNSRLFPISSFEDTKNLPLWTSQLSGFANTTPVFLLPDGRVFRHAPLPPGWTVAVSRSRGVPYYEHPDFGKTFYPPILMPCSDGLIRSRDVYISMGNNPVESSRVSPCHANQKRPDSWEKETRSPGFVSPRVSTLFVGSPPSKDSKGSRNGTQRHNELVGSKNILSQPNSTSRALSTNTFEAASRDDPDDSIKVEKSPELYPEEVEVVRCARQADFEERVCLKKFVLESKEDSLLPKQYFPAECHVASTDSHASSGCAQNCEGAGNPAMSESRDEIMVEGQDPWNGCGSPLPCTFDSPMETDIHHDEAEGHTSAPAGVMGELLDRTRPRMNHPLGTDRKCMKHDENNTPENRSNAATPTTYYLSSRGSISSARRPSPDDGESRRSSELSPSDHETVVSREPQGEDLNPEGQHVGKGPSSGETMCLSRSSAEKTEDVGAVKAVVSEKKTPSLAWDGDESFTDPVDLSCAGDNDSMTEISAQKENCTALSWTSCLSRKSLRITNLPFPRCRLQNVETLPVSSSKKQCRKKTKGRKHRRDVVPRSVFARITPHHA